MRINNVTLYHVDIPMKFSFRTAKKEWDHRESIVVEVVGDREASGFGEVVAFTTPFYTTETLWDAWNILATKYIPTIFEKNISHPFVIHEILGRQYPMAMAGLENALLDLYTKQKGENLIKHVFQETLDREIDMGVVLGDLPIENLLSETQKYYEQGCKRIKVKIKPVDGYEKMKQLTTFFPGVRFAVDANRSFSLSQIDEVVKFDKLGLLCIEEPFDINSLEEYRDMQKIIETPICLDESIQTLDDLQQAVQNNAFQVLNLKIGRVGGLFYVKQMIQYCRKNGVDFWVGSMVESGISKILHVQLSALADTYMAGDLSDSNRYFEEDLIVPEMAFENGTMACPTGNGLGVGINKTSLLKYTVDTLKVERR